MEDQKINDPKLIAFLVQEGHAQAIHWKPTLQQGCVAVFERYKTEKGGNFGSQLKQLEKIAIKRISLKKHAKVCEQDTSMFDDKSDQEIEALYDKVYGGVSP